jgi:hypothetical protein
MINLSPTLLLLLGACAVFLLSPYIPYSILRLLVGNNVSAALALGLVLYMLAKDRVVGLAVFLAVAALFLEQRRRTVEVVTNAQDPQRKSAFTVEQLNKPAPNIVPGEVHPPRSDSEVEDYSFEPTEESGTNKFENIDETYNEKHPLDTVPPQPSEVSQFLQDKGLAAVNSS